VTTPDFTIKSQDDLLGAAGQVSQTLSILWVRLPAFRSLSAQSAS